MNDRVKLILEEYNLSASKFASIVDVQASGISHILSGRNKPGYDFIRKVLMAFPEISPDWLILGNGDMKRRITSEKNSSSSEPALILEATPQSSLFNDQPATVSQPTGHENIGTPASSGAAVQPKEKANNSGKYPEKIIIFFSDKTFSVYSPE